MVKFTKTVCFLSFMKSYVINKIWTNSKTNHFQYQIRLCFSFGLRKVKASRDLSRFFFLFSHPLHFCLANFFLISHYRNSGKRWQRNRWQIFCTHFVPVCYLNQQMCRRPLWERAPPTTMPFTSKALNTLNCFNTADAADYWPASQSSGESFQKYFPLIDLLKTRLPNLLISRVSPGNQRSERSTQFNFFSDWTSAAEGNLIKVSADGVNTRAQELRITV